MEIYNSIRPVGNVPKANNQSKKKKQEDPKKPAQQKDTFSKVFEEAKKNRR